MRSGATGGHPGSFRTREAAFVMSSPQRGILVPGHRNYPMHFPSISYVVLLTLSLPIKLKKRPIHFLLLTSSSYLVRGAR